MDVNTDLISELADFLSMGGADVQYIQYLSKSHIISPQLCTSFYNAVEN